MTSSRLLTLELKRRSHKSLLIEYSQVLAFLRALNFNPDNLAFGALSFWKLKGSKLKRVLSQLTAQQRQKISNNLLSNS